MRRFGDQIEGRGVRDPRVLRAMAEVPREDFVPEAFRAEAYADGPLPIGHGQTISQPYIVAYMTELLRLQPGERVLEIGTGSGYQTAILSRITHDVYSVEVVPALHAAARERLRAYGLGDDRVICGDGAQGLPAHAPYDAILVTAAPETIPPALIAQLKAGGRLVVPLGPVDCTQRLYVVEKDATGDVHTRGDLYVRFVPLREAAGRSA